MFFAELLRANNRFSLGVRFSFLCSIFASFFRAANLFSLDVSLSVTCSSVVFTGFFFSLEDCFKLVCSFDKDFALGESFLVLLSSLTCSAVSSVVEERNALFSNSSGLASTFFLSGMFSVLTDSDAFFSRLFVCSFSFVLVF